ncbi:transcriptional regulator swi6 [Rhizopus stolonifer]|uniref:Transcriptional regulator swi6 n=1 Tax=Rhizopus stolonifer TaxID=4846 RepID=A0A367JZG8_RHIST|nr:transcriptional regulator swi6 [Rhizopus stolonifer]
MTEGNIYSAVYSGVPVFEMIVKGVAVMRRRTDDYMNATQILKVADIEKAKRTKILEKEVLVGEHEKVQGGYGKYQGTWIPFNKSKELAERYGVVPILAPLLNFELDPASIQERSANETHTHSSSNTFVEPKREDAPSQQRNYSPSLEDALPPHKKAKTTSNEQELFQPSSSRSQHTTNEPTSADHNRSVLMSIFLSDKPDQINDFLNQSHGKDNFSIDMVIDEQGNTALHWATSLARINTVELLASKGANIACTNYAGETPLMRSVMVTNNYDAQSFPRVFDLLKETATFTDNKKRTVLHHAALTGSIQGRINAAVYYMEILVANDLCKPVLNTQDALGDTALTIAARLDGAALVDALVRAGAVQNTQNHAGLDVQDYKTENNEDSTMEEASNSQSQRVFATSSLYSKKPYAPSQRGKEIVATVQKIVDALDEEYGSQLTAKEHELQSVQEDLNAVTQELEKTRKSLEERQAESQRLSEAQQKTRNLEHALQTGWQRLESLMQASSKPMPTQADLEQFDENEDIDAYFNIPDLQFSDTIDEEEKKRQLKEHIKHIRAKVRAYEANNNALDDEINELEHQFTEKEMQCKRLIAACCNLPIDKIDDLVEPLTLAIESDPPDLDLARVIGFMDKIRRQGAFTEPPIVTNHTKPTKNTVDSPH